MQMCIAFLKKAMAALRAAYPLTARSNDLPYKSLPKLTQGLDPFPLKLFNCFPIHRMRHPEIFQTVSSLTKLCFRSLL